MNLNKLFKTQDKLDDRIIEEKGLHGQDLLDKKILALQVELGELANEHKGFKFWSTNQEPRTEHICKLCEGSQEISRETVVGSAEMGYDVYEIDVTCPVCEDVDDDKNPLLEEYADCLSFILSVGNDVNAAHYNIPVKKEKDITRTFIDISNNARRLLLNVENGYSNNTSMIWSFMFKDFLQLGKLLGFTWEQIEAAYYKKNEINHARQQNGY